MWPIDDFLKTLDRIATGIERIVRHAGSISDKADLLVESARGIEIQAKALKDIVDKAEGIVQQGVLLNKALRGH